MATTPDMVAKGRLGYILRRLAPRIYDLDLRGDKVGALFRARDGWIVALDGTVSRSQMPYPFTRPVNKFAMLVEALNWLGNPPQTER